jgi:hypothetical protein
MKLSILKDATSVLCRIFIQDSSSTVGAGLTGLTSGSAGLVCYRARDDDGNAAGTQITLSGGTRGTWRSGGFVEKDATNMKGVYEFGIPNAALGTGSRSVQIVFSGATNMVPCVLEIALDGFDNQSTTDGGLSKLTSLTFTGANKVDASVRDWVGDTIPARNVTGVPIIDVEYWDGVAIAEPATDGVPDVNVKNINNVATTPVTTIKAVQGLATDGVVPTVTTLTNLPSIPANWLTAAGIAAAALNGKGDWMVSYTQPTGFLAATFPTGTIANTTNITAGTITTVTNLTNAATAGDLTATMKTSVQTAADAAITANATVVEINADVDELITSVAAVPTNPLLTTDSRLPAAGVVPGSNNGLLIAGNNAATQFARLKAYDVVAATAALTVAGSSQELHIASNTTLQVGDLDFWWAGWVKLTNKTGNQGLWGKWLSPSKEFQLYYFNGSDRFDFYVSSDGTSDSQHVPANTFGSPSAGTWYFIMVYHDSVTNTIGISVNGGAFDTAAIATGVFVGTTTFYIGADAGGSYASAAFDSVVFGKSPPTGIAALRITIRDTLYNSGSGALYSSYEGNIASWGIISTWTFDSQNYIGQDWTGTNALTNNGAAYTTGKVAVDAGGGLYVDRFISAGSFALNSTLAVAGTTTFTGVVTMTAGLTANITGNLIGTVSTLTTYTGNTPQTGDSFALANGASGFAAIKAETAEIDAVTDQFRFTIANQVDANAVAGGTTAAQVWSYATRALTASGLDAITEDIPSGPGANFPQKMMALWNRFFGRVVKDTTAGTIDTYAADNVTVATTQTIETIGSKQIQDRAS